MKPMRKMLESAVVLGLALASVFPVYGLGKELLDVKEIDQPSATYKKPAPASTKEAESGVQPSTVSLDLPPGASQAFKIVVHTAPTPVPKADVLFLFDVSSSMDEELDEAKSRGLEIMNALRSQVPDTAFGVASFSDYPEYYESDGYADTYGQEGDYPWHLNHDISMDLNAAQSAIMDLKLLNGGDPAESYLRALFEALEIGWRPGAKHIVVLFGDAPAHDSSFSSENYGSDPGRDAILGTADDLTLESVMTDVKEKGIVIMPVGSDAALGERDVQAGFEYMANQSGGEVYFLNESSELVDTVAAGLVQATSTISSLLLSVEPTYRDWITIEPEAFLNVGGNETRTFEVVLTVPANGLPGPHQFDISALGDGALLGSTTVNLNVQGVSLTPTLSESEGVPSTPSASELVTMTIAADPRQARIGEAVTVEIRLSGDSANCEASIIVKPVDVYLVIDHSGSMEGEPLEQAKVAAKAFIETIDLVKDRVGIVPFSDQGKMLQSLTNSRSDLNAALDSIPSGGGTSVDSGLMVAYEALISEARNDTTPVIILLSDGQSDRSAAIHVADTAKAAGIRIITIGLGGADEDLLKDLASLDKDGQPQYYFAPNPSDLQSIYITIAQNIREYGLAKDLILKHQVDLYKFAIVPDSPNPPAEIAGDTITWKKDLLEDGDTVFTFQVRGRVEGEYDIGQLTEASFLECEQANRVIKVGPAPKVTIEAGPTLPCESSCAWWQLFPWWVLVTLLFILFLFLLFLLTPLGKRLAQKPLLCKIITTLLLFYLILLVALFSHALLGNLCTSDQVYFWKYVPQTDNIGVYVTTLGQDQAKAVQSLNQGSNCVACHALGAQADPVLAVVRDDQNGPILMRTISGDEVPIPPVNGSYLAWSPDGKKIAISVNDKDIQILDLESGSLVPLNGASDPDIIETMPAWSPDGKTIAFVRASQTAERTAKIDVPADIYTIPASGGAPLPLPGASGDGFNYYPAYSPDGKWLAFTRHVDGQHTYADNAADIYLVPANGGERILLRANTEEWADSWPSWSPDSRWLGFSSDRLDGQFDIYLTRIGPNGQSVEACLLPGAASSTDEEFHPVWFSPLTKPWWQRILDLWPWLIPLPVLIVLALWACRPPKVTVTVVDGLRGTRISGAKVETRHEDW